MRLDRTKNAVRNTVFGVINQIVSIVVPFVIRTIFIKTLGVQYLGLNSMFASILSVLSLSELGFSAAVVFAMYKPIAEDDTEKINALLAFYKMVYRIVGIVILGMGLAIMPFLDKMIHGPVPPDINIRAVYLIVLSNTVISYFMFAYRGAIISAFQRNDLITRINIFIVLAMNTAQAVLLLTVRNYYAYLLVMPVFAVINNLRTAIIAKKYFPKYMPRGKLDAESKGIIKEKISGLVIDKACQVSRNAFDSIFVSMFIGLAATGIYNNYYFVMNSIIGFSAIITGSILAGAGNSVAMESVQKNYDDMNKMNFMYMWLAGWFAICLFCLYQPFMEMWVGSDMMFPMSSVSLFCVYFYTLKMGDMRAVYASASGLWWQQRYRAIGETVANILLNWLLGKLFGVNGIIAATLISLFAINFLYGSQIVFRYYFKEQSLSRFFLYHAQYAAVTAVVGALTYFVCVYLPGGYLGIVCRMVICAVMPNILYFVIYRRTKRFYVTMEWLSLKFAFVNRVMPKLFKDIAK